MLMGAKFQAYPTDHQKLVLSQWMGCSRYIWNAKCQENKYQSKYAMKYLPVGTYPTVDQTFSQYKNDDISPFLSECPSQILRNSAVKWFNTYQKFMKGICGKPKVKKKSDKASVYLTREMFRIETDSSGKMRLYIGTKRRDLGELSFFHHRLVKEPNSLTIRKQCGQYWVSFCYEDQSPILEEPHLDQLRQIPKDILQNQAIGVDRGVAIAVHTGLDTFDLTPEAKKKFIAKEKFLKRYQRRLSHQKKGSHRRQKTKEKIGRCHKKISNIREDFCHKTSHALTSNKSTKLIVFENLNIKGMTKKPKAKPKACGKGFEKNGSRRKAGLNRSILSKGWCKLEVFTAYKAKRKGIFFVKVPAQFTSQECADCSHIHPDNRKSQAEFCCVNCGYKNNADANAAFVIKKRAINLINSGAELSDDRVLRLHDIGRGALSKTRKTRVFKARSEESSKKKSKIDQIKDGSPLL